MNILGIALSGLRTAETRLKVTAHNLANLNTDGFKASEQTDIEESEFGGVRPQITTSQTPGPVVSPISSTSDKRQLSNTDLTQEMMNLLTAKRAYEANIKSLKTADEITKTTIDMIG